MSQTPFDDLTDVYEAMIDWPKRLGAEGPFFRQLFEEAHVQRVADVACGTGRHAQMFHSWGLEVEGSDISPNMIGRARKNFGEPEGLRWAIRGFDLPPGPPESCDAVVCVGNYLALAPDTTAVAQALRGLLGAARAGGLVVVHVLNLWKLPPGPCVWQRITNRTLAQGPSLILKGVHRCHDHGYVELVVAATNPTTADADTGSIRTHSARFLGLHPADLREVARERGASDVAFFGGHGRQPYDPETSPDLIMVARKEA
jgi:SAM-dependent methyltransferase